MTDYIMTIDGDRLEGRIIRENDIEVHIRMSNGSEAIVPRTDITEQGELRESRETRR